MDYTYLLYIAIILIFTKAFGLLSKVIKLPQVVGALVAGIILGPVCLNLVALDNAPILSNLSEIGVIVLMFVAGLETDIREMKKCGLASSIIALIGVIVPLVGGAATAFLFGRSHSFDINIPAGCFRRCYPYRNIGKYHCRNAQGTRKAQHKSG